uniref:Uncharacterized protein n=1 Tax=Arundo donax TaxID=35708 RepID=A0A0A9SJZ5_ARUDO
MQNRKIMNEPPESTSLPAYDKLLCLMLQKLCTCT